MRVQGIVLVFCVIIFSVGCSTYKRDILFRLDKEYGYDNLQKTVNQVQKNYTLKSGDRLNMKIYTNEGELLIDPNFSFFNNIQITNERLTNQIIDQDLKNKGMYLIFPDGMVRFPKIGRVKLSDLTIVEAEEKIQELYNEYYKNTFVKITIMNRRVVLLGATGNSATHNGGIVVPLENENMNLLEVIALSGGIQQGGKINDIKLIRGELKNPKIYNIDLSTFEGLMSAEMMILPGDIIYIEPWRRPFRQTILDISPVLSLLSSITTLILVLQNSTR